MINVDSFYGICIDDKLNNYVDIELRMKEDSVMRITIQFNSIQFFSAQCPKIIARNYRI